MRVNEVFLSNQGEGLNVGKPTVFVRFQGCNLNPTCSWCDTKYAQKSGGEELSHIELMERIDSVEGSVPRGYFCVTGGEPLYQEPAVYELVRALGLSELVHTEVFTNGSLPPPMWSTLVQWCVDVKCPSSKTNIDVTNYIHWLYALRRTDSVKFVVADEIDLDYSLEIIKYVRRGGPQILISPAICGDVVPQSVLNLAAAQAQQKWMQKVWEFCVQNNLRFSLQNHKVLYGNKKGV